MGFSFDSQKRLFRIDTAAFTYAMALNAEDRLCHVYYGAPLYGENDFQAALASLAQPAAFSGVANQIACDQEFPVQSPFDFGTDCLFAAFPDGSRGIRLRYCRHEISDMALCIVLRDEYEPLTVRLCYRLSASGCVLMRSMTVTNEGDASIILKRMLSAAYTLPAAMRTAHFCTGEWGNEYLETRQPVTPVRLTLTSTRGSCASHQALPFVWLDEDADDARGEVYFFGLQWSGDHEITVERTDRNTVRVSGGVSAYDTEWTLTKGRPYESPVFFTGYTQQGYDGMSRVLYDWEYDELCPQAKIRGLLPVIYNSWYPFEFGVTEENCIAMLDGAKRAGAELFVIDDGWMKGRTHDSCGLGDWYADPERFPRGLGIISDMCRQKGMKFGLWVEPEMCNRDSDLYRTHPDWVLQDEHRPDVTMRNQLVLDLSRDDVTDWCIAMLDRIMAEARPDYLKWDMNRYFSFFGDKADLRVLYIRNLYRIWEHLQSTYPQVLFENCASGGGRADFGMLPYTDRINRSDNADPVDVLRLHEGFTRLFLPKLAGGAGNISPCPNKISGRVVPLSFRAACGLNGSLSIGINLTQSSDAEFDELRAYVARYQALRPILNDCYVLHLQSIENGHRSVLQYLRRGGSSLAVYAYGHGMRYGEYLPPVRLRGLDEKALYRDEQGRVWSGSALMHRGIQPNLKGDYSADIQIFHQLAEDEQP